MAHLVVRRISGASLDVSARGYEWASLAKLHKLGATVDEAVSFYVDSLNNPREPRWCALAVLGSWALIQPTNENNMKVLVKKYHNFWSTSLAFLTTYRCPEELDALANSWGTRCHCEFTTTEVDGVIFRIHALSEIIESAVQESGEPLPRLGFLGKFIDLLADVFKMMRFTGVVKPVPLALGRRSELWPSSLDCLTPNGKDTTVNAIITLARSMGNSNTIEVLDFILAAGNEYILPTLLSSDDLLQYIIEHGSEVCDFISKTCKREGREFEDALKASCADMWNMLRFISHFDAQSLPEQRHRLYTGRATALFQFLCRAVVITDLPIPMPPTNELYLKILASMIQSLYINFHEIPRQRLYPTIRRFAKSMDDTLNLSKSPVAAAHFMILDARVSHACFRIGCTETFQSSGKVFQRCGGCKTVCYSSPECQRRAWSDKRLPHKTICVLLGKVVDATDPQSYRKQRSSELELLRIFQVAVKKARIPYADLARIAKWLCDFVTIDAAAKGLPPVIKSETPVLDRFLSSTQPRRGFS